MKKYKCRKMVDLSDDEEPDLPVSRQSSTNTEGKDLVSWIIIFLLHLQAKHCIPDAAMNYLIKFLWVFLFVVGRYGSFAANIAITFPKSLYELCQRYNLAQRFKKFVVCAKSTSIYEQSECMEIVGSTLKSRKCTYRAHRSSTKKCDNLLLKTVEVSGRRTILYQFKVYCYRSGVV